MSELKCWEMKSCHKKDCPAYGSKEWRCWLTSGTYCRDEIQGTFLEKMEACLHCNVFEAGINRTNIVDTLDLVRTQVTKLRQLVEREKEYFNNIPTFVAVTDLKGVITFCNEAPLRALGLAMKDVVGKLKYEIDWWAHDKTLQASIKDMIERAAKGESFVVENDPKLGEQTVPIKYTCGPLFDAAGRVTEIIHTGTPIVEQRMAMQQVKAANQQLRASEQQLRAANQQLRASEQQLKAANQQLEAHEQALSQSREELKTKLSDLERFNKIMVGREMEMIRLKEEVNALHAELGREIKYKVVEKMNRRA